LGRLFFDIATITIGLLIALALEQTAEYLHRRRQAREIAGKLRAEILENREVANFDIALTQGVIAAAEKQLRLLDSIRDDDVKPELTAIPLPAWFGYPPTDAVWLMARDSALLLLLPSLLVQNCWKQQSVCAGIDARKWMVERCRVRVESLLKVGQESVVLSGSLREALQIALSEYCETLHGYLASVTLFARQNEMAFENEAITYMSLPIAGVDRQRDRPTILGKQDGPASRNSE
jgi:hypothetical protein